MRQLDCWRVHVRKLEFEGLRAFPTSTPTLDKVKAMVSDLAQTRRQESVALGEEEARKG